jgi:hypothetical protein
VNRKDDEKRGGRKIIEKESQGLLERKKEFIVELDLNFS